MATFKAEGRPIEDRTHNRKAEVRAGAYDPVARLKDQDMDNIGAEVIYPGDALFLFAAPDVEYKHACIRAYNDWLAEFCSVAPDRLLGAAMLPVGGPIESGGARRSGACANRGCAPCASPAAIRRFPSAIPTIIRYLRNCRRPGRRFRSTTRPTNSNSPTSRPRPAAPPSPFWKTSTSTISAP